METNSVVNIFKPVKLTCEYVKNPIGVDSISPMLGWITVSQGRFIQRAYQIQVASSTELLNTDQPDMWDSGKVNSDRQFAIQYKGGQLMPFTKYWWRVRVWNSEDVKCIWSEASWFVTGITSLHQWLAKIFKPENFSVHLVRRQFNLPDKPVRSAYLFVAAAGDKMNSYKAVLNGERVGDDVSVPGAAEYFTMRYRGYEVADLLKCGENVINLYYIKAVTCVLKVIFEDESDFILISDKSWRLLEGSGPYEIIGYTGTNNGMHHGKAEEYNANMLPEGWEDIGFDCSKCRSPIRKSTYIWAPLFIKYQPIGVITGEKLSPVSIKQLGGKIYLVDFGKNSSGFPSITLHTSSKTTIMMRMAERLASDGQTLDILTYGGTNLPYLKYTSAGKGVEHYQPCFMHTSFRYMLIENLDYQPAYEDICASFIYSDVEKELDFNCSNLDINLQFSCFRRGFLSNMLNLPTDCPGRERRGWTADSYAAIEAESIYFNALKFYERWFDDMMDSQRMCGWIPVEYPMITDPHVDLNWPMHVIIDPWIIYRQYGSKEFLQKYLESMVKYVDLLQEVSDEEHCFCEGLFSYGDWWAAEPASKPFLGMAYYFHVTDLLSKILKILEKPEESQKYEILSGQIAASINKKYLHVDNDDVYYDTNSQSSNSHALHFGFCPEEYRDGLLTTLVRDIQNKNSATFGFMAAAWIYSALTNAGRADIAYKMISNSCPGNLLYYLKKFDATTVPERFVTAGSMNHTFLAGGAAQWLFECLLGIKPVLPGYKKFEVRPWFAPDMEFACGKMETLYGTIDMSWRKSGDKLEIELTVPSNTTADIIIPNADTFTVGSGRHSMEINIVQE